MSEFELDEMLDEADVKVQEVPKKVVKAKVKKFIDPEDDRANWPVIRVGRVKGLPNFQFLAAAGTKKDGKPFGHELKVMRGIDVSVPPSILNMLQSTVKTDYEQTYDPETHAGILTAIDSPPIPYQLVKGGKYF